MRRIGVVTTSRADYGIYRSVLRATSAAPDLELRLFVSGAHLSPEFGNTVKDIEADGFAISDRVDVLLASNTREGVAKAIGLGIIGFAQVLSRSAPDILVVLGDRFEMYAAAVAALPLGIPVAHIHGGELTEGAIDESLRHSMTKLSHLHFTATEEAGRRVIQLGEEPWRVTVSGAPALDEMKAVVPAPLTELEATCGMTLPDKGFLLVTFHPATLETEDVEAQIEAVLKAVRTVGLPVLFTMPNADAGGSTIRAKISEYVANHPLSRAVENLGARRYYSAMRFAAAMVGNSSSGIIEAASFALPVVNVGIRQDGRTRPRNVASVPCEAGAIEATIRRVARPEFRESLRGMDNPYGDGGASKRIVDRIRHQPLGTDLLRKKFHVVTDATDA